MFTKAVSILASLFAAHAMAEIPAFKEHVINAEAGTGLAITVADVNNDGKPDIVGVSADDVAWYENPTWERHLIAGTIRNSNVCIAAEDLDGDGIPEFALGADWQFNNTRDGGALFLLTHQGDVKEPWRVTTLAETEPTLHRIRWANLDGIGMPELIVAPLKGVNSTEPDFMDIGVSLYALFPNENLLQTPWRREVISNDLHIVHNVFPFPQDDGSSDVVMVASMEGLTAYHRTGESAAPYQKIGPGLRAPLIPQGAGEIRAIKTMLENPSSSPFHLLATIEPWHGHQAVVYTSPIDDTGTAQRFVLDDQIKGGHAVWLDDFDQDGEFELLVGFRDKAGPKALPGLNIYDLHIDGEYNVTSEKHAIDDGGMATEDARAADMNGDGWPDIVAFGRATHNIKYYESLGKP
jgi:hypothetical protein